jgi:hypothetical protein
MIVVKDLEVMLWMHTKATPEDEIWTGACARIAEKMRQRNGDLSVFRAVVVSDGGGPNSAQRAKLFRETYGGRGMKTIATSNALSNPLVRGIATAALWLNSSIKIFQPSAWLNGLTYLDLADRADEIALSLDRLSASMPVRTWQTIRDAREGKKSVAV